MSAPETLRRVQQDADADGEVLRLGDVDAQRAALRHWLTVEFPRVRAGLVQVTSGYAASVTDFETLAPAVTLA